MPGDDVGNGGGEDVRSGGGDDEAPREESCRREEGLEEVLLDIEARGVWYAEPPGEGDTEFEFDPTASNSAETFLTLTAIFQFSKSNAWNTPDRYELSPAYSKMLDLERECL